MALNKSTLVRYNEPVLVSTTGSSCSDDFTPSQGQASSFRSSPQLPSSFPLPPPLSPKCPISKAKKEKMEEILDAILPPKKWTFNSGVWLQGVSSAPSSRMDAIELDEQLSIKLQERNARKTGICDVRREVYAQCFDELVRQLTLECSVTGQLLARVRDEIRMSMDSYVTLDDRIKAFSIRKLLDAEQERAPQEREIQDLEKAKMALELELRKAEAEYEAIKRQEKERQDTEDKKRKEELERLSIIGQQVKLRKAEAEYEAINRQETERQAKEDKKREEELELLTNKEQQLKLHLTNK